jgi:hypothetical protein
MADYAISNVPRRVVYAASGVGPYAFTFEILDETDIAVYKASTLLTLTTDYTVTINADGTGEVTLVATAGTSNITIVGAKNIQRTSDFTTGGDLFADTLNDELDNQTIFIQQVAETAERGLKAPVTDPTDIAMTLPDKAGRRGKVLAFDSTTGNPVAGPSLDSMVTVIEQSAYINAVGENIDDVIAVADNEANIDTVAGVSSAVTTVATNISNVNTVASDLNEDVSEINTVAVNIANVNTVGNNIGNVNTVGGISANVTTVAGISSNVTTVAGISSAVTGVNAISSAVTGVDANATDISAVNANKTNIDTVAGISANVTTVAGISANVTSVAGNSTNINTVATDISNVNSVGGNIANVNSVAGNATNINAVNANATNINAVAGINANVTTVAGISANVTTVAGISANVTTVANNASNINQVASDTVAINSASANATSAAASALSASNSATSASASAAAASAVALGSEPVRHSVRPSLLLDFANTKTLDPRITFTRASTGTYYDGKTVAKAEENLIAYSQEFDNAYWVKNASTTITANAVSAPDGTTTADTMVIGSTLTPTGIYRQFNGSTGYSISCFAKQGTTPYFSLSNNNVTPSFANFDLNAGTVLGSSGCTASITSVGNGWYRCSVANTATAFGYLILVAKSSDIGSSDPWQTGAGVIGQTVYIWGAQLEQRSSVTAYTPTTTAPITNYIPALQTAASGVARFEHNPVTGESLGLEIEEQRANLAVRSEELDNASWSKNGTTVSANAIIAPDGTLTADKVIATATTAFHLIQVAQVTGSGSHTMSVYAKAGEYSRFAIRESNTTGHGALFDLSAGTVVTTNGGAVATITPVGNGWYRCTATVTWGASQSLGITLSTSSNSSSLLETFTGNGFSGIFIWGAQLEAGSFATSYIPTVASQVTRSADSATMTGSNFTSWYRADAHTAYSEYTVLKAPDATVNSNAVFGYGNGTGDEYVHLDTNNGATQIRGLVRAKATTYSASQGTVTAGTTIKAAIALSAGNGAFSANGATATAVNPVVMPLPTFANIGKNTAFSVFLNGNIKKVAFYPARLTNAELQGLTTV